ncbi:MAG: formylglycine-generating enzyme family protein [Chloroflexota bacterium]|nr:formylglycine-generating enzyme family protein [Chloroflexota bacterium]
MSEKNCCSPNRDQDKKIEIKTDFSIHKSSEDAKLSNMIRISQESFLMGTDYENAFVNDGEGPVREVEIDPFYVDRYPVTNKDFDMFCSQTGYITEAEKYGWSFVFFQLVSNKTKKNVSESVSGTPWWWKVDNAFWRKPYGPDSNLKDLDKHPVVHISWNDAKAYAKWIGKDLPTEAEWEIAARGGLSQKNYSWGNNEAQIFKKCNIWEGIFPDKNTMKDGWLGTSPVDYYDPNNYGVYDTAGNVWEWCKDWFSASFHQNERKETRINPSGPKYGSSKTMKGGSYLCHNSYCNRYRASARTQNTTDSSTGNLVFRLIYRNK